MKEIIRVENEVILTILENELHNMNIQFITKKLDVSNLPVNSHINEFAIIFSEDSNEKVIQEIYNNIKQSQKSETEEDSKTVTENASVLKIVFGVVCIAVLLVIIIIQQKIIQDYNKSLTVSRTGYTYKWSSDLQETDVYITKNNYLLQKTIDNDRNNIVEKLIIYYKDDIVGIAEDENQNSFFEKVTLQKDGIVLLEEISSNDDGIIDITYYYKDNQINQTLHYDVTENVIRIE
jgi:hypothetical protein